MRDVLDREDELRSLDRSGLLEAYLAAGPRLVRGYRAAGAELPGPGPWSSIAFCAMGGSAAAGDVVASAFSDRVSVPIVTVRGYELPAFCDKESIVVCVSYSGNTEESVAAYEEAKGRGCAVIAVSSGGELARRAAADGVPHVAVAGDAPQPRAALGDLTGAVLGVMVGLEVLPRLDAELESASGDVTAVAQRIGPGTPTNENQAKALAAWIGDRIPVIWGSEGVSAPAAWRWKCAFNENAEIPAFASALPELDHHEVAGWSPGSGERFALVVLREPYEHPSVDARLKATIDEVRDSGLEVREVWAEGGSPLGSALSLMVLGDA
ncbi:MAG TPA: bifunctional phosphoglucose/phosphomannose isomerase, partial [Actinomycetota bacterium]|nr:bifunctional phosphoglucose/phosphomannose isomerase [Actinomycetota bacterium]